MKDFEEFYKEEINKSFWAPVIHPNLDELELKRNSFSICTRGLFPQEIEKLNSHTEPRQTKTAYGRSHIEKYIRKIEINKL